MECHPTLTNSERNKFSIHVDDEDEKIKFKPLNVFYFEAVKLFQGQ